MENKKCLVLQVIYLVGLIFMLDLSLAVADEKEPINSMQTYIVWVKKPVQKYFAQSQDLESWYESFLPETFASSNQLKPQMVHMYRNVASGFAARLTPEGLKTMEKKEGFLSARPQRILPLHTTHSPNFLGLHQGLGAWKGANYGQGVIIGVLDTGISPDHPSFSDEGVPQPPAKWKGKCEFNGTVCNNKLIGAKNFQGVGSTGKPSGVPPFDGEGHGTHTASTAAGNFVKGAGVFGMANGTATGMAPYAHLAIYKVCSENGCADSDILAALDAAVEDGVDVLSLSLGGGSFPFYEDVIAIGAFGATQKGVFVSCSAGNSGPSYFSLSNEAPWILTVGASTIDRNIVATAKLGNDEEYDGQSLFQPQGLPQSLPLVYAGAVNNQSSPFCRKNQLSNVEGKIVLCENGGGVARIAKGTEVKRAGGAAMILMNGEVSGFSTLADSHVLPATHVSFAAGLKIKAYINSTSTPTATILFKGTVIGDPLAPKVASFSSRGPSAASIGILKPDIIGPGVSILAAWPVSVDNASVTSKATFNVISGTSMSCPHLSGIAALIKSSHPEWSPAAIKSAIMTTADLSNLGSTPIVDETLNAADIFATGAGHDNPSKATDPGLVYDIKPEDYFPYLCGLNYTDSEIQVITQQGVKCSQVGVIPEAQLNYPSFSIIFEDPSAAESQHYTRTVKNVGPANSTYKLDLVVPHKMGMSVNPSVLTFTGVGQEITFQVEFIAQDGAGKDGVPIVKGYLRWVSDHHSVSSPISVVFGS